jgi:YkgG family uncharacterized protein
MTQWNSLATDEVIHKTISALIANGISAEVVASQSEAKEKVLAMIPPSSEVMAMSSITLETLGLEKEINESGKYDAVKPKLFKMDRKTQNIAMQKLGSAPVYALGSVHAVTQDGHVLIASKTGSQLPAYVYGSAHVIWVVGTQKIVASIEDGMKRIYEYVLPLETEHMKRLYNVPSEVNKLLIINKETNTSRLHLIFVKEELGF